MNLNDREYLNSINNLKPKNIYVYGTGMIKNEFLNLINSNIYNLHWGVAPKYRGAGLIPCIINEDYENLGVTFHKINSKSDAGDIHKIKNTEITKFNNFYSIYLKLTFKVIEIIKDFNYIKLKKWNYYYNTLRLKYVKKIQWKII